MAATSNTAARSRSGADRLIERARVPLRGVFVSQAIGQTLHRLGGDVVFGLMGSGNLAVTNAIVAAGGRFVSARHETGALCMADGYARVSGRLGVASVHQGPGLTNAITGLTEAAKSRTPLILLAADTPAAQLRSNFRIDQAALVESVGAVAEHVYGPETAVADVTRAVRRAVVERRAVVLMLPLDVQAATVESSDPVSWAELSPVRPSAAAVAEVAAVLGRAERPAIIAGRGAVLSGAGPVAAAPGRGDGRRPGDLGGRQRALRGRPVRGRHLRRVRLPHGAAADRRGRRRDRLRRGAERLDDPSRRPPARSDGHPGRPRRGGDRRPPAGRSGRRRRRPRDRRGARRGARRERPRRCARRRRAPEPHARGGDRGRDLARRAVRGLTRLARPAGALDRARRDAAGGADRGRGLRRVHGLPVDVPARPGRPGLRLPAGLPVRRARAGQRDRARPSRGPTGSPSPRSATAGC